jgi:hypothetical protein
VPALEIAGDILESVLKNGQKGLGCASAGLAFSYFAAGLNIFFGRWTCRWGADQQHEPNSYAVLFDRVTQRDLERGQLFSTNTVTPMVVGLQKPNAMLSRYTAEG